SRPGTTSGSLRRAQLFLQHLQRLEQLLVLAPRQGGGVEVVFHLRQQQRHVLRQRHLDVRLDPLVPDLPALRLQPLGTPPPPPAPAGPTRCPPPPAPPNRPSTRPAAAPCRSRTSGRRPAWPARGPATPPQRSPPSWRYPRRSATPRGCRSPPRRGLPAAGSSR